MIRCSRFLTLAIVVSAAFVPLRAAAFCGFFVAGNDAKLTNNASQVVLLRSGNKTVMTLSNNYQGPPENFALVVPVPVVLHKEDVKTLPTSVFDRVDTLSAPRLVEYWERDPCRPPDPPMRMMAMAAAAPEGAGGRSESNGVKIEAQFTVGEYEVVVLSAKDSMGLDKWLRANHYNIPPGADAALAPYVHDQMKFFVAKVDIKKVQKNAEGVVQLSPLRFGFESNELRLPVRLGLLNANGKQDLLVYVIHPSSRFEVANYRNVFMPTNLEVKDEIRNNFAAFYAELFDRVLEPFKGAAVVTEYAWQTSSCDPCPTPPLTDADLATLGVDMLVDRTPPVEPTHGANRAKPLPPVMPRGPVMFGRGGPSWVLTRLHARYDKSALSEDLIFREAPSMEGGRSNFQGQSEDVDAKAAGVNNFQARYIIRHYWNAAVKCKAPVFNVWGGPPDGREATTAAKNLATAARGKLELKRVVFSPVTSLGLAGVPKAQRRK